MKEFKYLGYRQIINGSREVYEREDEENYGSSKVGMRIDKRKFGKDIRRRIWLYGILV